MEIVFFVRTVAEFADYSLSLLYSGLSSLLVELAGCPPWFVTCCTLSGAVALMCKVWRA